MSLCFLARKYLNHLVCWKDLFSAAEVVEAGMRLRGHKKLPAIVSLRAISLMHN